MRCTRCDRLAVPQAVGLTPDGRVVFGWCLECLIDESCTEIEVASRGRILAPAPPALAREGDRSGGSDRRRIAALVVGVLAAWSLILAVGGAWMLANRDPSARSPLGNGTPAFLLAGGGATAATCLLLASLTHGPALLRSRTALRAMRWTTFFLAAAILTAGIAFHTPRRTPFVVAAAGVVLGLSALAQRQERRLQSAGGAHRLRPAGRPSPPSTL